MTETPNGWRKWVGAALLVAGWFIATAIQWGAFGARLNAVEQEQAKKVDRGEYEVRQKDLRDQLDRIENKLDRNYRSEMDRNIRPGGKQ